MSLAVTLSWVLLFGVPQTFALHVDANVCDVTVHDVNDDGRRDIVALCSEDESEPAKRFAAVFSADPAGKYPRRPSCTMVLPATSSAMFMSETDGVPPAELVAAGADGATVYRCQGNSVTAVGEVAFASLLPSATRNPIFFNNASVDLDGDGIHEWLIPVSSGYDLFQSGKLLQTLRGHVHSQMWQEEELRIVYHLPALDTFAVPQRSERAVVLLGSRFADFFHGDGWTEHVRVEVPVQAEQEWQVEVALADVSGDGLPDLVSTQTQGSVNMRTVTKVFLADEAFSFSSEPLAALEARGALAQPFLEDVDGDGRRDIVVIRIPFGVKTFINLFVRRKLSPELDVHFYRNGRISEKPDFSQALTLQVPEDREQLAYVMGDFSVDERLDLAISAGPECLAVYAGSTTRFLSSKPWQTVNVPAMGVAREYDVDQQGGQDVIIFHPAGQNRKRIEVVLF